MTGNTKANIVRDVTSIITRFISPFKSAFCYVAKSALFWISIFVNKYLMEIFVIRYVFSPTRMILSFCKSPPAFPTAFARIVVVSLQTAIKAFQSASIPPMIFLSASRRIIALIVAFLATIRTLKKITNCYSWFSFVTFFANRADSDRCNYFTHKLIIA